MGARIMDKQEILSQARDYCGDIISWLEKEDYSSAQRMVSGLRKAIAIWKKDTKSEQSEVNK